LLVLKTTAAQATGQTTECRLPASIVKGAYWSILSTYLVYFIDSPEEKLFQMLIIPFQAPNGDALIVRQSKETHHSPIGRHGHAQVAVSIVVQNPGSLQYQLPDEI